MSKQNWNELDFFFYYSPNKMEQNWKYESTYDALIGFLDVSTPGWLCLLFIYLLSNCSVPSCGSTKQWRSSGSALAGQPGSTISSESGLWAAT